MAFEEKMSECFMLFYPGTWVDNISVQNIDAGFVTLLIRPGLQIMCKIFIWKAQGVPQ